jgi:hypothetical protein
MEHTRIAPPEGAQSPAKRDCRSDALTFTLSPGMAPAAPLMRLLASFDRPKVEAFAEISVALLDLMEDDHEDVPDFRPRSDGLPGDPGDHEKGGDEEQGAWVEWTSKPAITRRKTKAETTLGEEDDEESDDDAGVEDDPLGFDPEEDFGIDDVRHDQEHDDEREQMLNDVPMLPVVSAEYNIFTDARQPLGISNLMSSFVGQDVRSADTDAVHTGRSPRLRDGPGVPV